MASRNKFDDRNRKTKNMAVKKRPNTKGGFVMDSESDSEGNDHSDQLRSSVRQLSHASESPGFTQASLKTESSATSLPTKQLNKSRLNKLLGRAKTATTTPERKQSLAHVHRSVETTPTLSTASRPTASRGPQQSASLQSTGSNNAAPTKYPTMTSTIKGVKVLSQQAKVVDLSMIKTDGKTSSISREIQRHSTVITDHGRVPTQTNPTSTPPATVAVGSPSSPLLQQRKLVPGASVAQKRKLDIITGGSDYVSATPPKRPAPSLGTPLKRPETIQAISKVDTSSRLATASKAVVRKTPIETNKSSAFANTASNIGSNPSSSRTISKNKSANVFPSPAISTLVGRQGPSVSTSSNMCAIPVISHLPAHAKKAAINKPAENSRTSKATLLPQAIPVDRPEGFATIPTKSNLGKSPDPTGHASVAHDAATPAQHNDSFSDVIATSSLELNVSSERPTANKSGDTILGASSKGNVRHVSVTPYPEKALSCSVTTCPEESRQVAGPGLATQEQHGSTSTIPLAKAPPVVTAEPIFPATGGKRASTSSTTVQKPSSSDVLQVTDLTKSASLKTGMPVLTNSIENAALRSDKTPMENTEMDVDSVNNTAIPVQRDDAIVDTTMSVTRATNAHGPSPQLETAVETKDDPPLTSLEPASPEKKVIDVPEIALTLPMSPLIPDLHPPEVAIDSNKDELLLCCSSKASKEAQPYFEYSVFQKVWSIEQAEEDITGTEITIRPFTNIVEANGQAERAFQGSRAHFFDAIFESSNSCDEHGCSIFTGSATHFDNPTRKSHLKIWVQRDIVSKFANQTPQTLKETSFISSICYVLRLFNLAEQADTEGSDGSDSDDNDSPVREAVRVYHPHTRPEVYTTLNAANRAARALQIELGHEKEPKDASKAFQEKNLRELNVKVLELELAEKEGRDGCWKSKFNACGLGADTFEVVVEKTFICGPRNL